MSFAPQATVLLFVPAIYFLQVAFTSPNSTPPEEEKQLGKKSVYTKAERLIIVIACMKWMLTTFLSLEVVSLLNPGAWTKILGGNAKPASSAQLITSLILIILGGSLRAWCYRSLGHFFTFEIAVRPNHRLITTGPYSIVRHPSYVGIWLTVAGTIGYVYCSSTWLNESIIRPLGLLGIFGQFAYFFWASTWCMVLVARTYQEDKVMAEAFGVQWDEWSHHVKHFFIPGVY